MTMRSRRDFIVSSAASLGAIAVGAGGRPAYVAQMRTLAAAPLLLLMITGAAPIQVDPVEIDANGIFREAFIAGMEREPGGWQLQPARPRGPAPTGRRPFAFEEMTWRRAGAENAIVSVTYWKYSSADEAHANLQRYSALVSAGTREVTGLGDEAVVPLAGSSLVRFRRASFAFEVSAHNLVAQTSSQPATLMDLARRFLDAADRLLAAHPLQ